MFCTKCGQVLDEGQNFCNKCGNSISDSVSPTQDSEQSRSFIENAPTKKQRPRHGFTTFWIIFDIAWSFLDILFEISPPDIMLQHYGRTPKDLLLITVFLDMVNIGSGILLLFWKKAGFWIAVGCITGRAIFYIYTNSSNISLLTIAGGFIGLLIYYGILHLEKEGKTTWEQLI
jgi:hypothetical protein